MADQTLNEEDKKTVEVPLADLAALQQSIATLEKSNADRDAEIEGLKAMVADTKGAEVDGTKLRERKSYEPKFRTVRVRKFPIAGDITNMGYVIGWDNRGAYQEVDRTGVTPAIVDFINIIFLGHEKNEAGKLQAEKVKLLDFLNRSEQVHCKIITTQREDHKVPTGEEIDVTTWDPQHGLIATGDKIDGYIGVSDIKYTIEIPGVGPTTVDALYVN